MGESWRDARNGGYFSYNLKTNGETNLYLMVRYWGNESGNRTFTILIDDVKFITENISGKWNVLDFKNVEYKIPNSKIAGKDTIRVKFQALSNGYAGGVFYIRLLRPESTTDIKKSKNQPYFFKLNQNYPNPFNPETVISYQLPVMSDISLKVYNLLGQEEATLFEGIRQPGNYEVTLNSSKLASGVYFYKLQTAQFISIKKMLIIK